MLQLLHGSDEGFHAEGLPFQGSLCAGCTDAAPLHLVRATLQPCHACEKHRWRASGAAALGGYADLEDA
jgi:hypothetical protein